MCRLPVASMYYLLIEGTRMSRLPIAKCITYRQNVLRRVTYL